MRYTLMDMVYLNPEMLQNYEIDTRINRILLNEYLLNEYGDMEVVDYRHRVMQHRIDVWFRVHAKTITELIDTTMYQYDPIANYDRTEESTEKGGNRKDYKSARAEKRKIDRGLNENEDITNNKTSDTTGALSSKTEDTTVEKTTENGGEVINESLKKVASDSTTNGGSDSTSATGGSDTTNSRSAYNQTGFSPIDNTESSNHEESTTTYGATKHTSTDGTDTRTGNNTNTRDVSNDITKLGERNDDSSEHMEGNENIDRNKSIVDKTSDNTATDENGYEIGSDERTIKLRAYGNIGVTTTQQMIEQQRNTVLFNVYEWIVGEVGPYITLSIW